MGKALRNLFSVDRYAVEFESVPLVPDIVAVLSYFDKKQ
jgi:hypothetical protein